MAHPFFGLAGCDADDESSCLISDHRNILRYNDLFVFLFYFRCPSTGYVYVAKLCGGGVLTTQLLVRRGYVGGTNFDIVVGFDLDTWTGERAFFDDFNRCQPYVLIMGPPCAGMKGFTELNKILHPESSWKSRLRSERIGTIAGKAAFLQMNEGRLFFNGQPRGSDMYKLPIWQLLSPCVVLCYVQQCAAGLRGIRTGCPIRKDSEFWASDERILRLAGKFVCVCREQHAAIGLEERAKCAQVWPLALCRAITHSFCRANNPTFTKPTTECSLCYRLFFRQEPQATLVVSFSRIRHA